MNKMDDLFANNVDKFGYENIHEFTWLLTFQGKDGITYNWIRDKERRNYIVYQDETMYFAMFNGCCEKKDGHISKIICKNGAIHSVDEPAIVTQDNTTEWYKNGKYHRDNGPAIEYADTKLFIWYLDGEKLTFEQFWEVQKNTEFASEIFSNYFGKKE